MRFINSASAGGTHGKVDALSERVRGGAEDDSSS